MNKHDCHQQKIEENLQLKQLLDRISDGFVALDSQMNYTFVNEAGGKLLGRSPNDLIGKNYWTEFPEARGTPFANAYVKAFETQKTIFIEEYYMPWKRWFSNAIYPSHNGISIIFQEITERKLSEIALHESETRYAFLVQTANELSHTDSVKEVYAYTAQKINQLLNGHSIVSIVEYTQQPNHWKMQHLEGVKKNISEISKILGLDLNKLEGEISTNYYESISKGKLTEIPFDFPGLFNNKFSDATGKVIKNLLSIDKMYCIAFQLNKQLLGNITFITNKKTGPVKVDLIEAFISQASNFVNRLKIEEAMHKSNQRLESFLEISQKMTSTLEQKKIMQMIVDNAIRIIGLESGAIYLQNDEESIKLAATSPALPEDFPENFRVASLKDHPHVERTFQTGKHVLLTDALSARLTPSEREIINLRQLRSNLYLPIRIREKTIGVLILSSIGKIYSFTDEEIHMLQGFANQAAQIIENIHNYETWKQHARDLEKEVIERKRVEHDLIIAKEKAEEGNRLKTAFLQNMSHEIRTPLNAIIGFSELLNSPAIDEEKRKHYTDIIIEHGWQLANIITDIITISSLETGQERLRNDKIEINRLIGEQLAVFSQQASNNGLLLTSGELLQAKDAMVYADKSKLGQIFSNLIQNALKFTKEGEVVIGCQKQDNQLWFYVKDTGIGIDSSKISLIFERFAQADDTIRNVYGGTGLGLSICQGFVELMGGEIWVESEPGQGSTFRFTIPYEPVYSIPHEPLLNPNVKSSDKPITVVVAEDEESNFLYLKAMFEILSETLNIHLIHATNGQEAVDICREQQIDFVLMDIKMPIMDGHTATKQIKMFKPRLPVIAQTAYALKSEMQQYGDVFDDYITKPFNMEKLKNVFNKYFKIFSIN